MNLLLDTHTFLWFAVASLSSALPQATSELLEEKSNLLYLSPASVWETAIKVSIGKLTLPQPVRQIVNLQISSNAIQLLAKLSSNSAKRRRSKSRSSRKR